MTYGDYLKKVRKQYGYTTKTVAFLTGYSQSHISGIENNNRNVSYEMAKKILSAMATSDHDEYQLHDSLSDLSKNCFLPKNTNNKKELLDELYKAKQTIEKCINSIKAMEEWQ